MGAGLQACVLFVAAGCLGSRSFESRPGRHDLLAENELAILTEARAALARGDLLEAHARVAEVHERAGDHLPVACFLQDIELALVASGTPVDGLGSLEDGGDARANLYARALERVEASASTTHLVLAARVAPDAEVALGLLARAAALENDDVWPHYAAAFVHYTQRDFRSARAEIQAAAAIDPGHLATLRLRARQEAGGGSTEVALDLLAHWLERAEGNPLVDPREVEEARVDSAALWVQAGEPARALRALERLDPGFLAGSPRAELVRAVALSDRGDAVAALAAARKAARLAPDDLLPLVHQAELLAMSGAEPALVREVWEDLLESAARARNEQAASGDPVDPPVEFGALLLQLQAHAESERLARAPR